MIEGVRWPPPRWPGVAIETPFPFSSKTDANSDWTLSNERGGGHRNPLYILYQNVC